MASSKLNLELIDQFIAAINEETGLPVLICDKKGYVIRAAEQTQIGCLHTGATAILKGDVDEYAVTAEQASKNPMLNEGYHCPIIIKNQTAGTFGIIGKLDTVKPLARIAKKMINNWFKSLYEKEEKYRLIFENASIGIIHFNSKGVITACNNNFARIMGSVPEQIIGIDMYTLPDKRIARTLDKVFKGQNTIYEGEYTSVTGRKSTVIQSMFCPILSDKNAIDGGICIVEDITRRLKAEENLAKINHLNDEIIRSLPGLFYLFDQDKKQFVKRNDNWRAVTEYSDDELDRMNIFDFFETGEDSEKIGLKIKEVFKNGSSAIENNLLVKSGKKIPYLFTGTRTIIDDKAYLTGLGIDISDRKKAEQELVKINETLDLEVRKRTIKLKKLNEYLVHSEEEARARLATDLHDTVVQSLALSLSKIKQMGIDQKTSGSRGLSDIQGYLNQAIHETRQLIYDLCPPILKDFELGIALGFLVEENNKKYQSKLSYKNNYPQAAVVPEANKITIYRAVNELIMNVFKHSGTKEAWIEINGNQTELQVIVRDQGIGFDVTAYDKKRFGGFGLYSLSERLMNMGGTLKIRSAPGEGTKVVISAPLN